MNDELNDLYRRARSAWDIQVTQSDGIRAVVDLVLAEATPAPWDTLRAAADIMHPESHPAGVWTPEESALRAEAARRQAGHRAEQEKTTAEKAREALIEKAARKLYESDNVRRNCHFGLEWDELPEFTQADYRANAMDLFDAGLLAAPDVEGDQ